MSAHITEKSMIHEIVGVDGSGTTIHSHLASCDDCRRTYSALALALQPCAADDEELILELQRRRPVDELVSKLITPRGNGVPMSPTRRRSWSHRWRRASWAAAGAGIAASLGLILGSGGDAVELAPPAPERLVLGARAVEGRPSLVPFAYAPLAMERGAGQAEGDQTGRKDVELPLAPGEIEARRKLVGLFLWRGERGDLGRAEEALRRLPEGPQTSNDLGVLLLAQDRPLEAAEAFLGAINQDPGMVEAQFNLALAREAAGDLKGSIEAWERYLEMVAESEEEGWVEEARRRLVALQAQSP